MLHWINLAIKQFLIHILLRIITRLLYRMPGSESREANVADSSSSEIVIKPNKDLDEEINPHGVKPIFMTLTLMGTRMGGGVVGIPHATNQLGYVFALVLQILYLPIGIFSIWLLLQAKTITKRASLSDLGIYCYGNVSIYLMNILIALAQLGFPIIFFIVFGDVAGGLIERVNEGSSFWSSRLFTHSLLGILLLYLILQKEIQRLKYAGLVIL